MKHNKKLQSWTAAVVIVLASVAGLALAPPAGAVEDVTVARLAGNDRYETAVAVAKAAYPSGATTVVVASGLIFPDALAGAAMAGDLGAPLLLTERDRVPTATANGLRDLGATTVYVLGGSTVISTQVEQQLATGGRTVERIAGGDRYFTAAEIAVEIGAGGIADLDGRRTAFVATGLDFADALAGGPVAGAGDGTGVHPILLVNTRVPEATEAALTELEIEQVVILGGTAVVSSSVESELETLTGNPALRLAGADRYATAVAVARAAVQRFDFALEDVLLANGRVFADALAGGPLGAVRTAPIVLTDAAALPAATRGFLESESDIIEAITVLGGTTAVSDATAEAAEDAAEAPPTRSRNEALEVGPRTSEELGFGSTRQFTATGLGTTPVDIVLVDCPDVTTDNGETRLPDANTNSVADGTAQSGSPPDLAAVTGARIASVNGTARRAIDPTIVNDDYADAVAPVSGTVTFTVEGPPAGSTATVCLVPVVFVDANTDNALNGTATNPTAPSEAFGTGGRTSFGAPNAPAGQFTAHEVSSTDKADDRFTGCVAGTPPQCRTFRYDAGDSFQLNSQTVTLAQFEQRLSAGDSVRGTYSVETSGASTFNLTDAAPTPPTGVAATASGTTVRVTFTDSATPTVDLYRLYRATRTAASCPDPNTSAGRAAYAAVPSQPATVPGQPAQGETPDTGNASPPATPAPTYTVADRTAAASTTYCYFVVSVDREGPADAFGDESVPSSTVAVTTTTAQVTVTDSRATSTDGMLNTGDVLRFTFSGPVTIDTDATTADNTGVTVEGDNFIPMEQDLTCGPAGATNAMCQYDPTTRVLTMTITATTLAQYPLTLVDVFGVSPDIDVVNSDTNIQVPA